MDVRDPQTPEEVRAGRALTVRAWQEGYGDILSADALKTVEEVLLDQDVEAEHSAFTGDEVGNRAFVAVEDGQGSAPETREVVGWATLLWDDEWTGEFVGADEAELRACYVDPAHQGSGVGAALVESVLASVPESRDRLVLETVEAYERGRAFYEAQGFDRRGTGELVVAGESNASVVYERDC